MKLVVMLLFCCTVALQADVLLFDRGLPTANINDDAGANRSNVAWGDYTPSSNYPPNDSQILNWAIGDDFTLAGTGSYDVTDLRVWIVSIDDSTPDTMWSNLTLFGGGTDAGTISVLPATYTVDPTPVTYSNGQSYQGSSGGFISMYQVDFLLNWSVNAGTTYTFFVAGTPTSTNIDNYPPGVSPFLSASNAGLSGSTQQGADGLFREIGYDDSNDVQYSGTWDSYGSCDKCGGWDKSSDINVQLYGTVPEPSAILLLGLFGGALGIFGRLARRERR